jgi:drug/metabolite transporter (DMT)-like permease
MELWIPITVAAAFFQNLRSALQKHLKGRLSTHGATYARFVYAVPFVAIYTAALAGPGNAPVPELGLLFLGYTVLGGSAQIVATFLLIHLFSYRNFAVGTTYSKTETVQTAIFGILILGDRLHPLAAGGILVSLFGVMLMSAGQGPTTVRSLFTAWTQRPALIGIVSGAFFGISIVSYRAASLSLEGTTYLMQAATTLLCATVFQTLAMGLWMRLREPGEVTRVIRTFRVGVWVGVSGMLASACWLTAATLQNAAYVRVVGQIELVFMFVASVLFFHERPGWLEVTGIVLVAGGIVLLLLA